jgi:hypothetical protein
LIEKYKSISMVALLTNQQRASATVLYLRKNNFLKVQMNKNKIALVFAGIFLTIALASPLFFFIEETTAYQADLENLGQNLADDTQTTEYFHIVTQRHSAALAILAIVETVSVILFAIALWFALITS